MKRISEYLKIGGQQMGVPGTGEMFYDSLEKDVRKCLDTSWPIIADKVLASYSIGMSLDMALQSPIERLMYLGLLQVFMWHFLNYPEDCILKVNTTLEEVSKGLQKRGHNKVYFPDDINYELDFFLWLNTFLIGEKKRIRYAISCIIECDGHDFHEKTKEQARKDKLKDRTLEERDLHIIRFTGSEITRDPEVCALQVKDYIDCKVDKMAEIITRYSDK